MGLGFAATGVFTVVAALDLGQLWAVLAIGVSGLFTAPAASAMLLIRKQQSPATLRAAAAATGAAVAGLAAGVGGPALLAAIGVVWILSGAMLAAYPKDAPPIDGT